MEGECEKNVADIAYTYRVNYAKPYGIEIFHFYINDGIIVQVK